MSRCFGGKTTSSKEYISKKANLTVFCDIRKRYMSTIYPEGKAYEKSNAMVDKFGSRAGNNIACVDKGGVIVRYNNNSSLLNLAKAFTDFRTDIQTEYTSQKFKQLLCPYSVPLKDANGDNTAYTNNYKYHPPLLTTAEPGDTAQTREVQSWTREGGDPEGDDYDDVDSVNNRFAEIYHHRLGLTNLKYEEKDDDEAVEMSRFKNNKKKSYTQCPRRIGTRIGVIKANEATAPVADGVWLYFGE